MLVFALGDRHAFIDRLGHGPRSRGICAALQLQAAVDEGVDAEPGRMSEQFQTIPHARVSVIGRGSKRTSKSTIGSGVFVGQASNDSIADENISRTYPGA